MDKGNSPIKVLVFVILLANVVVQAYGENNPYDIEMEDKDVSNVSTVDSLPPIKDRTGNFITGSPNNPFDLKDPSVIDQKVEYDPATGLYIITEKIGDKNYRPPTYLTFDEYLKWSAAKEQKDYFKKLAQNTKGNTNNPTSKLELEEALKRRSIFGGNKIDIRPQGNIDLTFGGDFQQVDNPILTERQRRQGGFDFDMNIQMNVVGQIGNKLKLSTNYNTQATFDFENQMKLEYTGDEDEIIQKIEAGNVSLPLKSSLIQGSQSLFGIKTEMQFGRLGITTVLSQQKSRRKSLQIQGGSQQQTFEVFADQYDENRHFFLSHYNRERFEANQINLPQISTLFKITRLEVWVTNTRNSTQNVRDVVAFTDLGEGDASKMTTTNPNFTPFPNAPTGLDSNTPLPDNGANPMYQALLDNPQVRALDNAVSSLQSAQFGFQQTVDFQKVRARKLSTSEYTYEPDLGYISLNLTLQPDDVLAVAFQYTYNGETYQVGEFAQDAPTGADTLSVLYLKMLKSSTPRVDLPMWDLMMKNVYSIGAFQVNQQDFKLDVFYQDPGGAAKRFIPEGDGVNGVPLISLLNLDNLNQTGDPVRDGIFDFVPGITINPRNGRVIFPVLEPFGNSLRSRFSQGQQNIANKYVYDQLYDSTVVIAREYAQFNRYVIKGSYKSSVSSEISLGAFNIPRGSVTVTAGGQQLQEGQDYDVDYNIGRIRIINESILNSGLPVNVSFEDNSLFSFQTRTLIGARFDYWINDNFTLGATIMRLSERPFTQKVNIGDDPIQNTVYGLDMQYSGEAPWLTKAIDKLPLLQTKAPSQIAFDAEVAVLRPGSPDIINQGDDTGGAALLDDFEGSSSSFDLRTPATAWVLASTPDNELFPEARLVDSLTYGMNRAKIAWYQIDQVLRQNVPGANNSSYTRLVNEQEVFPNRSILPGQNLDIRPLDLAFYPERRGPYNFETQGVPGISAGLRSDGALLEPQTRWGGIMRSLQTTNFEAANIEFVEFWLLNPFLEGKGGDGGTLYINLGNVSEDILKDSRNFFENGLPREGSENRIDTTAWGRIPRVQAITNAFDNDPETRDAQDVGLDGLDDEGERTVFANYLQELETMQIGTNFLSEVQNDPSLDNYLYYNSDEWENVPTGVPPPDILTRYTRFNETQGNSRSPENQNVLSAATNTPDSEDINRDNTLSEVEAYFQYKIPLTNSNGELALTNYITSVVEFQPDAGTGLPTQKWYQFRVPVAEFTSKHGGIQDFRSIRFIRLYLRDFEENVVLRFGRLALVRNQWRRYSRNLVENGIYHPSDGNSDTQFDLNAVSIEENGQKFPFPYVLPPGVQRERTIGTIADAQQNEQSLAIKVCDLQDGDARGIWKTFNLDFRIYDRLKMFVHAESEDDLNKGELAIFMRIGSDFENNYYEYEIPLELTPSGTTPAGEPNEDDAYREAVWPVGNRFDFQLEIMRDLKIKRDRSDASLLVPYESTDPENNGNTIRIKGNPDLGLVKTVMIGVRNKEDNGAPRCAEVWVNELRVTGFDERGGYAARARLDIQGADFMNLTVSGNYTSIGWGSIEQRVAQRAREEVLQYDIAGSFQLGNLLGKKTGIQLPLYAQLSRTIKTPEYDPYKFDIPLKDLLDAESDKATRDSLRRQAQDYTSIKSINLTNVRKERKNTAGRKPKPWDIENVSLTAAYSETERSDPTISSDLTKQYRGGLDYSYSAQPKYIYPFKKLIKKKSKYWNLIKEFNFNLVPNSFNFNTAVNRKFQATTYRFAGLADNSTWFDKRFTWDRIYGLQWNLSKALNFNFNATNYGVIDELDSKEEFTDQQRRDEIWKNIRRFGRTKNYQHNISLSYTLPFKQIPILDWIQVRASYNANYSWSAAALNMDSLGNVIQNGHTRQINGDFNFVNLYNKSKYLKKINSRARRSARNRNKRSNRKTDKRSKLEEGKNKRNRKNKEEEDKPSKDAPKDKKSKKDKKKKKKKKDGEPTNLERALLRPLMLIRKARATYSEDYSAVIPGFMPQSRLLGMNGDFDSPGLEFIAGFQPSTQWLDDAAANGWMTNSLFLNRQTLFTYNQNMDARLTLEPFREFRIEVNATRTFREDHSEFFKIKEEGGLHEHLTPQDIGSLTVSFFALNTMFRNLDKDNVSETFRNFEENRLIISQRLGTGIHATDEGYTEGYGRTQQEVLIPAFLAAYTNRDANTINLDLFDQVPLPNWRLTYNGLSKLSFFKKIFKTFNVSHGYRSTLTVNSFATDLNFDVDDPFAFNPLSQSYYSEFRIPDLVISEQLSPLIGIDFRTQDDMTGRFEYKKSRNLAMNFIDYQLIETNTTEFSISIGYRIKNFKLPVKIGSGGKNPVNDLNIKFDFSFRDDITVNHLLDQGNSQPTRGLRTIRISPSIDYAINKRLNLRLFFDRSQTIPKTSASFPITNTQAGLTVRFALN